MLEEFELEAADPVDFLIKNLEGKGKDYIVKEASSGISAQYKNAVSACSIYNTETGVMTNKGLANTVNFLVSLCMHEATLGPGGQYTINKNHVNQSFVESLSNKNVEKIFNKIREISNLNENRVVLDALGKLFDRDDAPITQAQFNTWVKAAIKDDKDLRPLFMVVDDERTKNSSSDTTATSE